MPEETAAASAAADDFRCGTVAIVGRPNVGKSTLVNALAGQRLTITGPKPQTTRHRILAIVTRPEGQILLLDTPGLHKPGARAIDRQLNRAARQALAEADVVVHVVEAGRWTAQDEEVWHAIEPGRRPKLLVLNKIDRFKDKSRLLPILAEASARHRYDEFLPCAGERSDGVAALEKAILARLPHQPPAYPADELTDRSSRFLAAELVREQVMLRLSDELPYAVTVDIERFDEREDAFDIDAVVWVEREGQKGIVIGARGSQLKAIGTAARAAMERLFGTRVVLRLWVKVRENWSDDEAALRRFGYAD